MSIGFEVTGAVSVPEGLLKIARRFSAPCSRRTETPGYSQSFLRDDEVEIPAAAGEASSPAVRAADVPFRSEQGWAAASASSGRPPPLSLVRARTPAVRGFRPSRESRCNAQEVIN